MSFWTHQIVKIEQDGDDVLQICEVYYNDKSQPIGYTNAHAIGANLVELNTYVEWMAKALQKEILTPDDFVTPTIY